MNGYNVHGDWDARLIPSELLDTPLTTKRKKQILKKKYFKIANQIRLISSQTNSIFLFTEPPSKSTKTKKAPAPPKKTKTQNTVNEGASTSTQPTAPLPHTSTTSSIEMEFPTQRFDTTAERNNVDDTSLSRVIITRPIRRSDSTSTDSTSSLYSTFNIRHLSSVTHYSLFLFYVFSLSLE